MIKFKKVFAGFIMYNVISFLMTLAFLSSGGEGKYTFFNVISLAYIVSAVICLVVIVGCWAIEVLCE